MTRMLRPYENRVVTTARHSSRGERQRAWRAPGEAAVAGSGAMFELGDGVGVFVAEVEIARTGEMSGRHDQRCVDNEFTKGVVSQIASNHPYTD